jgi:hypothetical protein
MGEAENSANNLLGDDDGVGKTVANLFRNNPTVSAIERNVLSCS